MDNLLRKLFNRISVDLYDKVLKIESKIGKQDEVMAEQLRYLDTIKNNQTAYLGHNTSVTRLFTGQKIYLDSRDLSVAPHLIFEGVWESDITNVFKQIVKPGDKVADLGANFGYFALVAGSILQNDPSRSKLVAVEANPELIPFLEKSFAVNGLLSFGHIANYAVSDKKEELKLNILENDWGSNTLQDEKQLAKRRKESFKIERQVKVPAKSFDEIAKEYDFEEFDVIKLDIEGFEEKAYPAMKNVIKKSKNLKMLIEFSHLGYQKPKKFYDNIAKDFKFIYTISDVGLTRVDGYNQLLTLSGDDWAMLLVSKNPVKID